MRTMYLNSCKTNFFAYFSSVRKFINNRTYFTYRNFFRGIAGHKNLPCNVTTSNRRWTQAYFINSCICLSTRMPKLNPAMVAIDFGRRCPFFQFFNLQIALFAVNGYVSCSFHISSIDLYISCNE